MLLFTVYLKCDDFETNLLSQSHHKLVTCLVRKMCLYETFSVCDLVCMQDFQALYRDFQVVNCAFIVHRFMSKIVLKFCDWCQEKLVTFTLTTHSFDNQV